MNNQKQIEYKIYKIEKLNSYYLIYCEKDGEKYKIVSKEANDKKVKTCKKIKIGESYNLKLVNYPDYSKNENPLTGFSPLVNCFTFDSNTNICKEPGVNGLYTAKNLTGLYYIK
ncbi:uncharacterized protein CHSO_2494 [Chryseobacterium sp. StRB126]|nr:uncharacterized protein CHSO_2494 [Chryseobacterium sp. StRB126]